MEAISKNNIEIAKMLIKAGADINGKNGRGNTALMEATWKNNIEIAKMLIEAGADISIERKDGVTATRIAKLLDRNEILGLFQGK